ncbi:MAG: filamentous hemagglutinin N-terminal domain-containing protein, partial [Planctomycetes bacterium]|nr:filamentous hemagglutinin N-terminal domain-containing protein [Planctomycetota bacterium]
MSDNHRTATSVRFVAPIAATLVAVTSLVGSALGGPVNPIQIQGTVTIVQDGRNPNIWTITTSDGAIIEYFSFDVSASEFILFQLPGGASSTARVLNRITGGAPSFIDGNIGSNGIVYFVNPAGVIFGSGAGIDVGGIYAAAGSITNSDFKNHIDRFSLTGVVDNQGTITGNLVHLLGNSVVNNGSINIGDGVMTMVSGDTVLISPIDPNGHVMVTIDVSERAVQLGENPPSGAGVVNSTTGVITAAGGQIVLGAGDLFALAIRNDGIINAPDSLISMSAISGDIQNTGGINSDNGLLQMTTLSGKIFDSGAIATEQVEMSADQIVLESSIESNNILFDGAVLLEESVDLFLLELNPDEVLSVTFNSTLDSAAGENNSLGIFHDLARFNGQVGAQSDGQLGELFVFGSSEINTDLMVAGVFDFDDILLLQNTTLDASTQALFFGGIDSEDFEFNNLVINSPDTYFAGQIGNLTGISLLGNLTTNGTTTIDTDAINTLFNIDFNGDVFIARNTTVTGGFEVNFNGRVDSEDFEFNSLTVNSIDTYFGGRVGGLSDDSRLGVLHTDSAGTTTIDTDMVRALVSLDFDYDGNILQNTAMFAELSVDFAGLLDRVGIFSNSLTIFSNDIQ